MQKIVFISFDIRKDDYPSMPYSIACLIAVLQQEGIKSSHYSIDLQHILEEKFSNESITKKVISKLKENLSFFKRFEYIAVSLNSWSIEYCQALIEMLNDFEGKVILGGYEVTSRSRENLISSFPRADFFIKGYAEKAIKKIILGQINLDERVLEYPVESKDLVSPYLTGILPFFSRKIYWETKRGCKYKCGFCEWGNATIDIIHLDYQRLLDEIELIKGHPIEEVNILDGTFNDGKYFIKIFEKLLEIKDIKINCQAHFDALDSDDGEKFMNLCIQHKDRVHLEFGLQTIHKNEMKTIKRGNSITKVSEALARLEFNKISYEVSIIYAIPGQTVLSFIDTIEYLINHGCKTIRAFPLCIPKNSKMKIDKEFDMVQEGKNKFNVFSVRSSFSFTLEQREDMDRIAERINTGELTKLSLNQRTELSATDKIFKRDVSKYQWEIIDIQLDSLNEILTTRILNDYINPTLQDIQKEDFRVYLMASGHVYQETYQKKKEFYKNLINGSESLTLKKWDISSSADPIILESFKQINPNLKPKNYRCKVHLGTSSNIYVFREVTTLNN